MMAVLTKSLAFACVLILSGCMLNQTVQSHTAFEVGASIKPASAISLYVYPHTESVSGEDQSGYFVEFDLADKSDIPTIKYQD